MHGHDPVDPRNPPPEPLLPSADGSKLFAVQGDPQSASRRMVAIDVGSAANQSIEVSSRLANAASTAVAVEQQNVSAQRGF